MTLADLDALTTPELRERLYHSERIYENFDRGILPDPNRRKRQELALTMLDLQYVLFKREQERLYGLARA